MIKAIFQSLTAVFCAATLTALPAQAADLRILDDHPEGCHAMLSGQIVAGDADKLRQLIPAGSERWEWSLSRVALCLDSPGGNFLEGLEIAKYLRETGISTHIPANTRCESACALAFLGGTQLWVEDGLTSNRSRSMHTTARLGFHAPQLNVDSGQFTETAVRQAFDVAIKAAATIFASLDELRISRAFALAFFEVPGQQFYTIDTPERARELGVHVTHVTNLPSRVPNRRIVEICEAAFPQMGPNSYQDGYGGTSYVDGSIHDLPDAGKVARSVYLSVTAAEGTLMIDACEVRWQAPDWLNLRLHTNLTSDRAVYDDYKTPSMAHLRAQLQRPAASYVSLPSALAAPMGTTLADLADRRTGTQKAHYAVGTCAAVAQTYKVTNVKNFSNMRSAPGFGEPIVMEVRKGWPVTPLDHSLAGAAVLSDACQTACALSQQPQLTPQTMDAASACAKSNDVWWKVRTHTGVTGWMSSKFLSP